MDTVSAGVVGVPRIRPAKSSGSGFGGDKVAVAAYVAAITADLALIAQRHDLDVLRYLLDMARLEAEGTAQGAGQG